MPRREKKAHVDPRKPQDRVAQDPHLAGIIDGIVRDMRGLDKEDNSWQKRIALAEDYVKRAVREHKADPDADSAYAVEYLTERLARVKRLAKKAYEAKQGSIYQAPKHERMQTHKDDPDVSDGYETSDDSDN